MRIIRENRGKDIAYSEQGEFKCEVTGKFRFEADSKGNFPTVGDWVVASKPPRPRIAYQEVLMAVETSAEYIS